MPFIVTTRDELMHSAKGSTWKNHKYIKKIGDKYIYATTKSKAANAAGSSFNEKTESDGVWTHYEPETGKAYKTVRSSSKGAQATKAAVKKKQGGKYDKEVTYPIGNSPYTTSKNVKSTESRDAQGRATTTYSNSPAYKAAQAGSKAAAKANAKKKYNAKVKAYDLAKNATSKATGKAKDTGAKKSTKNYNKQSDKKTKTAKTINDIVNAAVAAAKKKKKKK